MVPGDNVVDTRKNEAHTTDFDESTVNVSEAGGSQSVVIPDVRMTFVPDDNVADRIQREKSTTDVLDETATEFNISNLVDRIEGEASTMDEPVKNVDGNAKKDDTFNDVQAVFGREKMINLLLSTFQQRWFLVIKLLINYPVDLLILNI